MEGMGGVLEIEFNRQSRRNKDQICFGRDLGPVFVFYVNIAWIKLNLGGRKRVRGPRA